MVTAIGEARFQRLLARSTPLTEADIRRLSPMLILSPHQDDETLGAGGLIATAAALGLRPRVAYLTDGGASHVGSPTWSRERLARLRAEEALAALGDLGVPPEDVQFLGWPDAAPHAPGDADHIATVAALKRWFTPASVWSTWSGEAHCDHLATAQLAEAYRGEVPGFAYVVWGWNEVALDDFDQPLSLHCPNTVGPRTRAVARHASQLGNLITDAPDAFRLPPEVVAVTARTSEVYFQLP